MAVKKCLTVHTHHYVTWSNVLLGYGNKGGEFCKTCLLIHIKSQVEIVVASMALHNYIEGDRKMMRFSPSMIAIPISFQMTFYLILYLAQLFKDHRGLHVWILYEMELQIVWWDNEKLLLMYKDYSFCYVIIIIKQQYFANIYIMSFLVILQSNLI
jgi:hypothetical protein